MPDEFIRGVRSGSVESGLRQLRRDGRVTGGSEGWQLTASGISHARRNRRNQRLWDLYRLYGTELGLPDIQEERQLDIETVLPAAAVAQLEGKLEPDDRR